MTESCQTQTIPIAQTVQVNVDATAMSQAFMGAGYERCRAFVPHWDLVRADTALPLLEWINDPVELVWGDRYGLGLARLGQGCP